MTTNDPRVFPIEIGGKFFQLRYDFNAIVGLEEETGKSHPIGTFKGLRALIWVGLRHNGRNAPTLEEVGVLLTPYLKDPKRYQEICETAGAGFDSMFPPPPKELEADSKNAVATPGTGT